MMNLFKNCNFIKISKFSRLHLDLIKTPKMGFAKIETIRKINEKLHLDGFTPKFYEEAKQQMPMNDNGLVKLDKKIFNYAVEQAKNEGDIEYLINVIADYMGHNNPLSGNSLDEYVSKAIDLGCPNKIIPLLENHRALMYYPEPRLMTNIMKIHHEAKNWAGMKEFYEAISRKFYIKKEALFYDIVIQTAFANKDYSTAVEAFLDILDYKTIKLQYETYVNLIYSNQELLLKDTIFVELFEYSNVHGLGVTLPLLAFYTHLKNDDKINFYIRELEKNEKDGNSVLVYDAPFMKDFLKSLTPSEGETQHQSISLIKDLLSKTSESVFDPSYKEILDSHKI